MNQYIDLGSEILVDPSTIYDPYARLLAVAIGQKLLRRSPWLAIDKSVARAWCFPGHTRLRQRMLQNSEAGPQW